MYKNVHFRIALFGHETTWLYVCIVGEILILLVFHSISPQVQMECVMKILFPTVASEDSQGESLKITTYLINLSISFQ